MHCGVQRTCNNAKKIEDWENNLNDCDVSSLAWRNSDQRCSVLTLFPLKPDGRWRMVALPLQCSDHAIYLGSGSQVKMDGLHLVSPTLVSYKQKARRRPTTERSCSIKSFTTRSFSGSKLQHQSRDKGLANEVSRWNPLPDNSSCQTSFNSSDSSFMIPSVSNASNLSDIHIDVSKVKKAVKRNSKKKGRKKGKQIRKLVNDTGLTDLECAQEGLQVDTCISKNADYGIGPRPCAPTLAVSSLRPGGKGNDSEKNCSQTINCSETPKMCTSFIDEGDALEASFIGEHPSDNSENGAKSVFPECSLLNGGERDTHSKLLSYFSNSGSSAFSETNDLFVLDSISVGSNGDETATADYDVKLSNKESSGITLSEHTGYITKMGPISQGNMINGNADICCHAQAVTSQGEGCSSSDIAMRGKNCKRLHRNSAVSRLNSVRSFYGRSGKENNHSIWQKVQRNDIDESNYGLRKVNHACSQSDIGMKEAPLLRKNHNVAQHDIISTNEDTNQSKVKESRKLRRKRSPMSKQDFSYCSRKVSYTTKVSSNMCTKINMPQNKALDITLQVGGEKGLNGVLKSYSKSPSIGFQTNGVESITSVPVHSLEVRPSELESLELVCVTLSSLNDQTDNRESRLLSAFCDHRYQTEPLKGQSIEHPAGGEEGIDIAQNVSSVERGKEDRSSGSTFQKWIPIGTKDSVLTRSGHANSLLMANIDKPAAGCLLETIEKEMSSDLNTFASSVNASITCTVLGAKEDNNLHSEDDGQIKKHRNQRTYTPKDSCINHASIKALIHDFKDQNNSAAENNSNKIAQAVNDAYMAQLASEAVQIATGGPIAEFERLLYSASPVISQSHNILSCQTCFPDGVVSAPLCRHETASISLGNLWQWYEKHGIYGLEVRAEDYENSTRLGVDRFAFRAYFVPFLSAIQLFRRRKSHPSDSSDTVFCTEAMEACKLGEKSEKSSNIGCLPIFPVLVPQPCIEGTSYRSPRKCVCCSETSSVCKGNSTIRLGDSTCSDDLELLFEYFEVEQPQKRRPLFEMIKELVSGDGPSQCRVYGDPTKLDSVALNDLHPKSWYSVAWYPIYRIPDGNFRTAFLTYHSLGHLVRRSATSDSFNVDACVVSPAVGLLSYNGQGECWFQLRQDAMRQTTEIPNLNPCGILKERLRTLEQTASLMARAVVTKGNLTSNNRQPDYEFFLSRRRW